ncbi:hypothetical protein HKCCE3408_03695 [Rhodobacterales bacterium HKCCE3408]|nr:hypothetical protein [Rhodobacterales bacterium HKCCE3408]
MVSGRSVRPGGTDFKIDRVIAVAAVSALILLIIIGLRAIVDRVAGANTPTLAGIRLLAPDDRLVTFEDFEMGAPGWTGGALDQSTPAFGGILGRFGGTGGRERISRTFEIDPGSQFAMVSFTLHAIDDWGLEDIVVYANGVEVLRRSFSTRPGDENRQRTAVADLPWIRAFVRDAPRSGTERGFGSGSDAMADQSVAVSMVLFGPPEELRIGFGSTLPGDDTGTASWAVDNFQIITTAQRPED